MMMILYGMAHPFMWKSVRKSSCSCLRYNNKSEKNIERFAGNVRPSIILDMDTHAMNYFFLNLSPELNREAKRGENQWNLARALINQKWATFYCAESSNLKFKNFLWNSLGCFRKRNSICFSVLPNTFLVNKLQSKSINSSVPFASPQAKQTLLAVGSSSSRFFRIKPKMNRKEHENSSNFFICNKLIQFEVVKIEIKIKSFQNCRQMACRRSHPQWAEDYENCRNSRKFNEHFYHSLIFLTPPTIRIRVIKR